MGASSLSACGLLKVPNMVDVRLAMISSRFMCGSSSALVSCSNALTMEPCRGSRKSSVHEKKQLATACSVPHTRLHTCPHSSCRGPSSSPISSSQRNHWWNCVQRLPVTVLGQQKPSRLFTGSSPNVSFPRPMHTCHAHVSSLFKTESAGSFCPACRKRIRSRCSAPSARAAMQYRVVMLLFTSLGHISILMAAPGCYVFLS